MQRYLYAFILVILLVGVANAQPVAWTQADSGLYPFWRAGCGVLGNYFYCFGGQTPGNWEAQAFNLTTELWEESTPPVLQPWSWNSAGVATADAIYLIGGNFPTMNNYVQKFTPMGGGPTGYWTILAEYPILVSGSAAAWDGGNFIYSAVDLVPGQNNAFRYDITSDLWTPIANMPAGVQLAGGAFINGRFYVVGGAYSGSQLLEYNPITDMWTYKTPSPFPVPFSQQCTVTNGSLIFVVGGGGGYIMWPLSDAVQIYDPLTDTWTQETALPEGLGANSAGFVPPDKVIAAGSIISYTPPFRFVLSGITYRGTGFPVNTAPDLTVNLLPMVEPIQIPASGGTFDFLLSLINNETTSQQMDVWTRWTLPGGGMSGPLLGPITLTISPGTRSWFRHQNVPSTAAPGLYTYSVYAGDYPNVIWATDFLQFTKLATGDGPWVGDWACTGEEIAPDVGAHSSAPIPAQIALTAQPNPFNPTTAISYKLQASSCVSLRVYDTAGRLVADLANGWRQAGIHDVTFDGSALPSGIYFAKLTAGDFSQVQKMVLMK